MNEQIQSSLMNIFGTVVQLIDQEMSRLKAELPPGAEMAIGDGTFLAMLFKLLEMLLPLILKNFLPTATA